MTNNGSKRRRRICIYDQHNDLNELINIIESLSCQLDTENIWKESSKNLLKIFKSL